MHGWADSSALLLPEQISEGERLPGYLFRYFLYRSDRGHVKMATSALEVNEEAVFDAALDGLLGRLHQLCRRRKVQRTASARSFTEAEWN